MTVNTDGGSRGNPGPAAIGVVIRYGDTLLEHARTIGNTTNNVAEYTAVVDAISQITPLIALQGITSIGFNLDSELVVKQIRREYKVKDPGMIELNLKVQKGLQGLGIPYKFNHVLRGLNKEADKLVNKALDGQI